MREGECRRELVPGLLKDEREQSSNAIYKNISSGKLTLTIVAILSPSQLFKFDQLFKFLNYSLNSRDIALPQVVVFFLSSFRSWI